MPCVCVVCFTVVGVSDDENVGIGVRLVEVGDVCLIVVGRAVVVETVEYNPAGT